MNPLIRAYFDVVLEDVALLNPMRLLPPDPTASWLQRRTADGRTQARRLDLASTDLERIARGWRPSEADLVNAPLIENWRLTTLGGALVIEGTVTGHPVITDGHSVLTSALVALDLSGPHWARTVSRHYRLQGKPGQKR